MRWNSCMPAGRFDIDAVARRRGAHDILVGGGVGRLRIGSRRQRHNQRQANPMAPVPPKHLRLSQEP